MQKISVIIPVFNSSEWLNACLSSVINQTYSNIEIIAIDDHSSDSSLAILEEFKAKCNNMILLRHEITRGAGAARNTGLQAASGDYISFLDSDDEWANDFCETLINIIGDADIAVAGRATFVNGQYTKSKTASSIETVDTITATQYALLGKYSAHPVWGKLFKRELVSDIKFDEQYIFEDIRYSVDTMLKACRVVFSDKDMYFYKMRQGSIMTANNERQIKDYAYAAEYVYQSLLNSGKYQDCDYAFRVFLARGIIRNTRQFVRYYVNEEFFKKHNGIIIDLYEKLGGL